MSRGKHCTEEKRNLIKKKQADVRLKFAQEHINWPKEKWRNILWTDKSKIVLFGGTGTREYVRRPSISIQRQSLNMVVPNL